MYFPVAFVLTRAINRRKLAHDLSYDAGIFLSVRFALA